MTFQGLLSSFLEFDFRMCAFLFKMCRIHLKLSIQDVLYDSERFAEFIVRVSYLDALHVLGICVVTIVEVGTSTCTSCFQRCAVPVLELSVSDALHLY